MNCPVCKAPDVEECANEVDIGVGVQRFVWGYLCSKCGEIPVCSDCGCCGNEPGDHFAWCRDVKSLRGRE